MISFLQSLKHLEARGKDGAGYYACGVIVGIGVATKKKQSRVRHFPEIWPSANHRRFPLCAVVAQTEIDKANKANKETN